MNDSGETQTTRVFAECLAAADSPDNAVQQQVMRTIDQFRNRADLYLILLRIFSGNFPTPALVRQRAGLLLKTALQTQPHVRRDFQVAQTVLALLHGQGQAQEQAIGKTAASVLATYVELKGEQASALIDQLARTFPDSEGARQALALVVEDQVAAWRKLSIEEGAGRANTEFAQFLTASRELIFPTLLKLLRLRHAAGGAAAGGASALLKLANQYVLNFLCVAGAPLGGTESSSEPRWIPEYLETLGELAGGGQGASEAALLSEISRGFTYVASHHGEELLGKFPVVAQYMLRLSSGSEYEVRLHALEFWGAVAGNELLGELLGASEAGLAALVRILLENMVYAKADYENMDESVWASDDAATPDREESLAPTICRRTQHGDAATGTGMEAGEEEEEEGEGEGEGNLWGESWTARKAAARSLDLLAASETLGERVIGNVLPLVETALGSGNWQVAEAGVLALGAIGNHEELVKRGGLRVVIGNILVGKFLSHSVPLVRSITLWTLSRLAGYVAFADLEICGLVISSVLEKMQDRNKAVQQAAVSSVTPFLEQGGLVGNFYGEMAKAMARNLGKMQTRNRVALLDAIANLIDVGASEEFAPLAAQVSDLFVATNPEISTNKPLFMACAECMCSLLGSKPEILQIDQLARVLAKAAAVAGSGMISDPDIVAAAVDVLASAVSAGVAVTSEWTQLGVSLARKIGRDSPDFLKQSVMALLGDLLKKAVDKFEPGNLYQLVPIAMEICRTGNFQAANNAVWALGELANQKPLGNFVPSVSEICVEIAKHEKTRPLLRQNACITFGRLGKFGTSELVVAPSFATGLEISCAVLAKLPTDAEKTSAALGVFGAVMLRTTDLSVEQISGFLKLVASFFPAPPEIREAGKMVFGNLRQNGNFAPALAQLPTDALFKLKQTFGNEAFP